MRTVWAYNVVMWQNIVNHIRLEIGFKIQSQYLSDFVGQIVKKLVKGVIQKYFFGKLHRLSSNVYRISEK